MVMIMGRTIPHGHTVLTLIIGFKHETSMYTFTLKALSKTLSKTTYNKSICHKKEKQQYIAVGTIRSKCQALTITRLTHSPYATKLARIRCYTVLSIIFRCQDVQHTISA